MSRFEFARRVPGRGAIPILWWDLGRFLTGLFVRVFHRARVLHPERVPRSGAILFVSNHQSFLDPILNGMAVKDRQFSAVARAGLFRVPPLSWFIRSYGALSVSGDGGDMAAIQAAIAELRTGRCVLIYPEGSRSPDGTLQPFKRGALLLQRRAAADVLPIGIDGSFDAWPRSRRLPALRGRITVAVGEPIPAAILRPLSVDAALALLAERIEALRLEARADARRRSGGRWPRPGPADRPAVPAPVPTAAVQEAM